MTLHSGGQKARAHGVHACPLSLSLSSCSLGQPGGSWCTANRVRRPSLAYGYLRNSSINPINPISPFGVVNMAVFNAGVGGGNGSQTVLGADFEQWRWVEAVNFWGVLYGCKV